MSETHDIVPTPKVVRLGDREVAVGPLQVRQLLQMVKVFEGGKLASLNPKADLLDLIHDMPEEMIQVCMVACDARREEIDRLDVADFVTLCADIIEANRDFFARRIGPALQRLAGELIRVAQMAPPAGSMRSSP
jgi:hypothetical protein